MDIDVDAAETSDAAAAEADAPPARFTGGWLFAAVRVGVTLAILAGLMTKLSPGEIRATFRAADAGLLFAALVMMCVVQALVVVKWRLLMRARNVAAPLTDVVRAYCVGNLLSNVLPTAVGGDVYRVFRIQRESGARAADVTMSVLYERATGYAAMTVLGALGAAFYFGSLAIGVLALAAGAAAALVLAFVIPRMPFPAVRHDHFLRNLLAHRRELVVVYQMGVFSLVIQALYISTIAVAGLALGVHVSWWYWAFTTWVVAIAVLVPITLGGLGIRESSFSGLLHRAGATPAQGASTGFALGGLLIVSNALGLLAAEVASRLGWGERPESPAEVLPTPTSVAVER